MSQVDFTPINHIEIRNGQARIAGRNVKVKMVISRLIHGTGATIEEVMNSTIYHGLKFMRFWPIITTTKRQLIAFLKMKIAMRVKTSPLSTNSGHA